MVSDKSNGGKGTDTFAETVASLKTELTHIQDASLQREEWLRTIYQMYHQRFLSDNNRIWTVGAILLPVSLSAFAIPVRVTDLSWIPLCVLALASTFLIWSWIIIADNHRAFQQKSLAWVVAIQELLNVKDPHGFKLDESWLARNVPVHRMRWMLGWAVPLGWVLVVLGKKWAT